MTRPPYRTGRTNLTDADLIILDAMFSGGALFRNIRRADYAEQQNTPYTHNLSDQKLRVRLEQLCQRQVIEQATHEIGTWHRLTAEGGALWSAERMPIWDRYCDTTHSAR
jgi:hypothetical protein